MKLRKRLRRVPETILLFIAANTIPWLPRSAVCGLASFLGRLFYRFDRRHRRIAYANLEVAFGERLNAAEIDRITRAMFRSQALVLLDMFWFYRRTHQRLDRWSKTDAAFDAMLREKCPVLVTGHISNWEIVSLVCGLRGGRFTSIYMEQKNSYATRMLNNLRQKTGSKIVKREGGLRGLLKSMREGRGTGLLLDQNTLPDDGGIFVPFFGLPAPVSNITGVFIEKVPQSQIFMVWCAADARGVYHVHARNPFPDGMPQLSRDEITARVTSELERIIRDNPEHWVWTYKRWRFYRPEDDRSRFPFYSESYESYVRYRRLVNNYRKAKAALDAANEAERRKRRERKLKAESGK